MCVCCLCGRVGPGVLPSFTLSTTFVLNGVDNGVSTAAFGVASVDLDPVLCWVRVAQCGTVWRVRCAVVLVSLHLVDAHAWRCCIVSGRCRHGCP
jgi:hypothetical protein